MLTEEVREVRWQSGYFSASALGIFAPTLLRLARVNGTVRALIGSNNGGTLRDDVRQLVTLLGLPRAGARLGIVRYSSAEYHPKTYHLLREDGSQCAYVGSANLTSSGLALNVEAGLILDTRDGDPANILEQIVAAVDGWFDPPRAGVYLINGHADLQPLVGAGVLQIDPPPAPTPPPQPPAGEPTIPRLRPLVNLPPLRVPVLPSEPAPATVSAAVPATPSPALAKVVTIPQSSTPAPAQAPVSHTATVSSTPPPVLEAEFVAVDCASKEVILQHFNPFIRRLHAYLNQLPCLRDLQQARRQWNGKGKDAFGENFSAAPDHWYTYNHGGRTEAQFNVGLTPSYLRVGLGFEFTQKEHGHPEKVTTAYTCFKKVIEDNRSKFERFVTDNELEIEWTTLQEEMMSGGQAQFVPTDNVVAWLLSLPTMPGWLFIGRLLRRGQDAKVLEDSNALGTVMQSVLCGFRPYWEQAQLMAYQYR
jgi:hypothetical protein